MPELTPYGYFKYIEGAWNEAREGLREFQRDVELGLRGIGVNVRSHGAKLDTRMKVDCSIISGTDVVFDLTGMLESDVGKVFIFYGAGPSGSNLVSSITEYISAASVRLAHTASTTKSSGDRRIIYGTDDTAAFQAAIDYASNLAVSGLYGGRVTFDGLAIISDSVLIENKSIDFGGNGWGAIATDTSTPNTIPGAGLIWAGPAGLPMIDVDRCIASFLHDFRLFGNSSAKPIGIRIRQIAGGSHITTANSFARLWLGRMYVGLEPDIGRTFATGIFGDTNEGNCDHFTLDQIKMRGIDVGFDSNNDNVTYWDWQTFLAVECGVGFKAKGDCHGRNWFFALNDLDFEVGAPSFASHGRLILDHFGSEASTKFIHFHNGTVQIKKGSWQMFPGYFAADDILIDVSTGTEANLRLHNFDITSVAETANRIPKVLVGQAGSDNSHFLEFDNCSGFDQTNILAEVGPANDGRVNQHIVVKHKSRSIAHVPNIDALMRENEPISAGQHDMDGKFRLRGGPLTVKKLKTAGFFYAWPTDVIPTGSGATAYSYMVAALCGGKQSPARGPVTCTNAATLNSTTNFNTVRWKIVHGAEAYRIYGRTNGAWQHMVDVPSSVYAPMSSDGTELIWIDDGSITPSGGGPVTLDNTGGAAVDGLVEAEGLVLRSVDTNVRTLEAYDTAGVLKMVAFSDGNLHFAGPLSTSGSQIQDSAFIGFNSNWWNGTNAEGQVITVRNRRRSAGATDYALVVQNNAGDDLAELDSFGRFIVGAPNSAPYDPQIANNQYSFYLDEATNKLKVRVRYSDGSYKTGEIALT